LLARIDSAELSEWMGFYSIEPFGEERADLRSAIIACTMANAWRGKNQRPFKVSDFIPNFGEPKEQTPEEILMIFKAAAQRNKKTKEQRGKGTK